MIRLSRTAPLLIATVASALLVAGPAYAQDPKPPVGSTECTALVEKDPKVVAANVGSAGGLPAATEEAVGRLCSAKAVSPSSKPTSSSSTPPSSPSSPSSPPLAPPSNNPGSANRQQGSSAGAPKNRPGRPAGDRDCADFATQDQAQEYFESIGGSATNNADRLDANANGIACENLDDDGDNQNASVTTTGDDESKADTSGEQVTEVPEGSAQTGGNS